MSTAAANPLSQPTDQAELNALLCDSRTWADENNIPASAGYTRLDGSAQNRVWGVSTNGVWLETALSSSNLDPFYPAEYNGVSNPDSTVEFVDHCLANTNSNGRMSNKAASNCIAQASRASTSGWLTTDKKTKMLEAWAQCPYRKVLGVSKDGRPILTPYKSGGVPYDSCDVDVCNGVMVNGHYMYATTFFHPYIMGCYGRGNSLNLY